MQPNIIVSVLESLQAEKDAALTRAMALAQWYESDLHIAYVLPNRGNELNVGAVPGEADARMAHIVQAARAGGITAVPAVLSGNPVRSIADYAERISADLVVVGNDARRASGYWSAGSFAAALAKAVNSPTIAVAGDHTVAAEPDAVFRNILVPIDFSDVSGRALTAALLLAQQSGGRLRLLHALEGFPYESVYSGSRASGLTHELRARVARVNRALHSLIPTDALNWSDIDVTTVSGRAHEVIATAASEQGADLIVVGLPRRSRLEEFVAGSTAQRVLHRAAAPVLLVPGPSTSRLFTSADERNAHPPPWPDALARFVTRHASTRRRVHGSAN